MIEQIRQVVTLDLPPALEPPQPAAAVLIAITEQSQPKMILTLRSSVLRSHAGEVAFPGGKQDLTDADLVATALRESHEEIGMPPDAVEVLGNMPTARSKFGIQVTPVVGLIDPQQPLVANPEELDAIFSVPLDFFLQGDPTDIYQATYGNQHFKVPCYNYQGQIIWGLTAHFIVEFMNRVFDANIQLSMRAQSSHTK